MQVRRLLQLITATVLGRPQLTLALLLVLSTSGLLMVLKKTYRLLSVMVSVMATMLLLTMTLGSTVHGLLVQVM